MPENQAQIIDISRQRAKGYDASGISSLEPWRKEAVKMPGFSAWTTVGCTGHGLAYRMAAVVATPTFLLTLVWHYDGRRPTTSVADGLDNNGAVSCRWSTEAVLDGLLLSSFWETASSF